MSASTTLYRDQVLAELEAVPDEYMPFVLQLIRSFHDAVLPKRADNSFRQGWKEFKEGETYPVAELWEGISDE